MSHECDDDIRADAVRSEMRRARVAHRCSACRSPIRPGDSYQYTTVLYAGTIDTIKRCARCQAIYEHLADMCRAKAELRCPAERLNCGEDYRENWGEDPPPEIAALAFALPGEVVIGKGGSR